MTTAVIYARFSSQNQREESIEGQIRECRRYAERSGYSVIKEYTDSAISGRTDQRPAFQQMIEDSASHAFQIVLVWKVDRFARNRYDSAVYRNRLKKNGVKIVSVTESFSEGPEGIILEGLMESLAEYYSANLSENISRGMYDSALQRRYLGKRMLGYRKGSDGRYEIDPDEALVVRRIFNEYQEGKPQAEIVADLNRDGFRTSRNMAFTKNSIYRVISNEKYTGMYRYKDIEDPDGIPPIISKEQFEAVQKMADKKHYKKRKKEPADMFILTGKLYCGHCGHPMTGESARSKNGSYFRYYTCTESRKRGSECQKRRVQKEWIEAEIIRIISAEILSDEFIGIVADAFMEKQAARDNKKELAALNHQLKEVEKKINNINSAMAEGIWSTSTGSMLTDLEVQKVSLEASINEASIQPPEFSREAVVGILTDLRQSASGSENAAMSLIDGFVKRIYLFDLEDKDQMNVVIEYSPTGHDEDVTEYREIVGVREEHHRLHLMLHKRTLLSAGSSVIVEYHLNKKRDLRK